MSKPVKYLVDLVTNDVFPVTDYEDDDNVFGTTEEAEAFLQERQVDHAEHLRETQLNK